MPAPTLPGQGQGTRPARKVRSLSPKLLQASPDSLPLSKLHALEAVDLGSFRRVRFARTILSKSVQ